MLLSQFITKSRGRFSLIVFSSGCFHHPVTFSHPGISCFPVTGVFRKSVMLLMAVPYLCFPIWISLLFSFSLMQCQLGVLPLGTGNDLARVLGWGSACDDDTQLPQILEKLERASTKMLDRWVAITTIICSSRWRSPSESRAVLSLPSFWTS